MPQMSSYGYSLTVTTNMDITSATTLAAYLQPFTSLHGVPTGTLVAKPLTAANIVTAATGTVNVPIAKGDLPLVGWLQVQVVDTTPGRGQASVPVLVYIEPNIPTVTIA